MTAHRGTLLVAVAVLSLASGCGGRAPDACGDACAAPAHCGAISAPGFFGGATALVTCTQPCGQDIDCASLGELARCTVADRCIVPCETDADCAFGACDVRGCGLRRVTVPTEELNPWTLALGAEATRTPVPVDRFGRFGVRSSDPGVLDAAIDEASGIVTLRALSVGAATIDIALDHARVEQWTVEVGEAVLITIGAFVLWSGGFDPIDLQQESIEGNGFVIVVGRSSDGARLALGETVSWSLDDPTLATLEPLDGLDVSTELVVATASGSTILRARFGDLERAIPLEVAVAP